EYEQANTVILIALAMATPFFVVFGGLSDKIGRRNIMLLGMLLGVLLYRPIFQQLYNIADASKKTLVKEEAAIDGSGAITASYTDGSSLKTVTKTRGDGKSDVIKTMTLAPSGKWKMVFLIALMVLFVTMVYGPVAAFLVELFPTRIRYTSMSLPYHIGNGVFGGLVPFIATLVTTIPGTNHLSGLWYPIGVAALCFIIGLLYLSNKPDENIQD
ncbi:MAG TPA: hypothetical protein VM935_09055, partial [Chitinophagaceae bacterium]|nr:hypothetical protein [Chitinophagaceae bacterium]